MFKKAIFLLQIFFQHLLFLNIQNCNRAILLYRLIFHYTHFPAYVQLQAFTTRRIIKLGLFFTCQPYNLSLPTVHYKKNAYSSSSTVEQHLAYS